MRADDAPREASTMRTVALVLAFMACAGRGRRFHPKARHVRGGEMDLRRSNPDGEAGAPGTPSALLTLLHSSNPAALWQIGAHARLHTKEAPSGHNAAVLTRRQGVEQIWPGAAAPSQITARHPTVLRMQEGLAEDAPVKPTAQDLLQKLLAKQPKDNEDSLAGTWAYGKKKIYKLTRVDPRQYSFEERYGTLEITGVLQQDGEWYEGPLSSDGRPYGFMRVRPEGSFVISNYRPEDSTQWGEDIIADSLPEVGLEKDLEKDVAQDAALLKEFAEAADNEILQELALLMENAPSLSNNEILQKLAVLEKRIPEDPDLDEIMQLSKYLVANLKNSMKYVQQKEEGVAQWKELGVKELRNYKEELQDFNAKLSSGHFDRQLENEFNDPNPKRALRAAKRALQESRMYNQSVLDSLSLPELRNILTEKLTKAKQEVPDLIREAEKVDEEMFAAELAEELFDAEFAEELAREAGQNRPASHPEIEQLEAKEKELKTLFAELYPEDVAQLERQESIIEKMYDPRTSDAERRSLERQKDRFEWSGSSMNDLSLEDSAKVADAISVPWPEEIEEEKRLEEEMDFEVRLPAVSSQERRLLRAQQRQRRKEKREKMERDREIGRREAAVGEGKGKGAGQRDEDSKAEFFEEEEEEEEEERWPRVLPEGIAPGVDISVWAPADKLPEERVSDGEATTEAQLDAQVFKELFVQGPPPPSEPGSRRLRRVNWPMQLSPEEAAELEDLEAKYKVLQSELQIAVDTGVLSTPLDLGADRVKTAAAARNWEEIRTIKKRMQELGSTKHIPEEELEIIKDAVAVNLGLAAKSDKYMTTDEEWAEQVEELKEKMSKGFKPREVNLKHEDEHPLNWHPEILQMLEDDPESYSQRYENTTAFYAANMQSVEDGKGLFGGLSAKEADGEDEEEEKDEEEDDPNAGDRESPFEKSFNAFQESSRGEGQLDDLEVFANHELIRELKNKEATVSLNATEQQVLDELQAEVGPGTVYEDDYVDFKGPEEQWVDDMMAKHKGLINDLEQKHEALFERYGLSSVSDQTPMDEVTSEELKKEVLKLQDEFLKTIKNDGDFLDDGAEWLRNPTDNETEFDNMLQRRLDMVNFPME